MPHPDPPSSLSRYRVVSSFKGWSSGETFNAFDPLIERNVVVELFSLAGVRAEDAATIKGVFYREMQRVGALTHPNVARLFDVGETPEGLFATWERVEGPSLDGFIHGSGPADAGVWLKWLRQTAGALEYAHLRGILHLNLSPTCVLIDNSGEVKVVGFGIAPVVDLLSQAQGYQWTRSSHDAPERATGRTADTQADWFSFAAIAREVVRRTLESEPPKIREELDRALDPDPMLRTPSALPLLRAVEDEFGARGLIAPQDDAEEKSSDSVTAVFNRIIDADRPLASTVPTAGLPGDAVPAASAPSAAVDQPSAGVARRSRANPLITLIAAGFVLAVAALMTSIWARSPMLTDVWHVVAGRTETPSSAPISATPAAGLTQAPETAAAVPQTTAVASPAEPAAAPGNATPAVVIGVLRIVTQPAGATITVDGKLQGVAPVRVDGLSIGGHSISASLSGHAVARQNVQLTRESPSRTLGLSLAPVTALTGILAVSSTPSGAALTLDGRSVGNTPTQLDVTAGPHTLRVEQNGFASLSRDIEVVAGRRAALDLTLEAISPPSTARRDVEFDRVAVKPRQVAGTPSPSYPPAARLSRLSGAVVLSLGRGRAGNGYGCRGGPSLGEGLRNGGARLDSRCEVSTWPTGQ